MSKDEKDLGPNPLTMSDEDIANMEMPDIPDDPAPEEDPIKDEDEQDDDAAAAALAAEEAAADKADGEEEDPDGTNDGTDEGDDDDSAGDDEDADEEADPKEEESPLAAADGSEGDMPSDTPGNEKPGDNLRTDDPHADEKASKKKADKPAENVDPAAKDDKAIDYESEYKALLAPFKANNREITVGNVEDARTLMQMGANYNKKMAALKPNLKIMRKLENNDLLDEEKLNFLIDLDKKNPDAITKLIKDSKIDLLNVDTDAKSEYKPKSYNVNDKEVELSQVLDDIQSTDTYDDTIDIITKQWDDSSKREILDDPEIIRTLNAQLSNGIYEEITTVVEQEQMLGKLSGKSNLEAYFEIGNRMQANKEFKSQRQEAAPEKPIIKKVAKKEDPKIKERKRAAGGSKIAPGKGGKSKEFNPLALSDEEIEKMSAADYLK